MRLPDKFQSSGGIRVKQSTPASLLPTQVPQPTVLSAGRPDGIVEPTVTTHYRRSPGNTETLHGAEKPPLRPFRRVRILVIPGAETGYMWENWGQRRLRSPESLNVCAFRLRDMAVVRGCGLCEPEHPCGDRSALSAVGPRNKSLVAADVVFGEATTFLKVAWGILEIFTLFRCTASLKPFQIFTRN